MGKHVAKPKPGEFTFRHFAGQGYFVLDSDGRRCAGPFKDRLKAGLSCERHQREADQKIKRGPRPCLCCGETFDSEGIHNRLCVECRGRGGMLDPRRAIIATRGRAA